MEPLLRMPGSSAGQSPFEAALRRVASGGRFDLAAPYLSVALLRELSSRATDFRLVTDAEEWLRAFSRPARREIISFIAEHHNRVRHYRDLNAKVALSPTLAMFGSANFTTIGLHQRQEGGALVSDSAQIAELSTWYHALWFGAAQLDAEELQRFEDGLPDIGLRAEEAPLAQPTTIRVEHAPESTNEGDSASPGLADVDWGTDSDERLIAYLAYAPSRAWAESYFAAVGALVEALGVENGDRRFVVSLRFGGAFFIPVTINSRWVLRPYFSTAATPGHGAMFLVRSDSDAARIGANADRSNVQQFGRQPGETGEPPVSVGLPHFGFLDDAQYRDEWLVACHVEFLRKKGSQNQRSHSRIAFRTAAEPAYRQRLFAQVNWRNA